MSPVSFERVGNPGDRQALVAQARLLADAGLKIQSIDDDGILVRSDLARRARAVLADSPRGAGPASEQDRPPRLIEPVSGPVDARVDVPGSKSHTNRALLCAALAAGRSTLRRVLVADDTAAMIDGLTALGVAITVENPNGAGLDRVGPTLAKVDGGLSRPSAGSDQPVGSDQSVGSDDPTMVSVRQSGTTSRFLLPVLAGLDGHFVLDGHPQLQARPFGPQIDALAALGARIEGRRLPLVIHGRSLDGGAVEVAADVSSQFLSGLLLAAPLYGQPTEITVEGPVVSRPYVDLTLATMAAFGVDVAAETDPVRFTVPNVGYRPAELMLEPDASAASYFFAAAAITGGRVVVDGLGRDTLQGDLGFVELLAQMGAQVDIGPDQTEVRGTGTLRGIEVDAGDLSDTAQTLAVVAAFANTPTTISGIGFIRYKETDRIGATVTELRRRGIEADEFDDGMVIHPGSPRPGLVQTYDDHRMAMSFALLGLVHPGIQIENPACVAKTFPDYFERLDRLR